MPATDDIKTIIKMLQEQDKRISNIEKILTSSNKSIRTTQPIPVKKSNPKSVLGLIEQMKEENFFDTPKTLKEINARLRQDGYIYNVTSLTNPLQRLLKQRRLGRISVDGLWAYVKR